MVSTSWWWILHGCIQFNDYIHCLKRFYTTQNLWHNEIDCHSHSYCPLFNYFENRWNFKSILNKQSPGYVSAEYLKMYHSTVGNYWNVEQKLNNIPKVAFLYWFDQVVNNKTNGYPSKLSIFEKPIRFFVIIYQRKYLKYWNGVQGSTFRHRKGNQTLETRTCLWPLGKYSGIAVLCQPFLQGSSKFLHKECIALRSMLASLCSKTP